MAGMACEEGSSGSLPQQLATILLEIDEFKREISLPGPTALLMKVSDLAKRLLNLPDVAVSLAGGSSDFFLQMWSEKWQAFIDLQDVKDVKNGSKLKVTRKTSSVDTKSSKVGRLQQLVCINYLLS